MDATGVSRRLLGAVVALIVLVAIGAPAVLLTAGSAEAQDTTVPTDTAPQAPPPTTTTTTEAPPTPADPAPEWTPSTTYDQPEATAPPQDGQDPPAQEQPSEPSSGVGAQNQSTVIQAIVQVQVGCHSYCHGTTQSQSATQESNTTQSATAVAPEGGSSSASATNQSTTMQYVWQTQLGCVAFCWDTQMSQTASQEASTSQTATAVSDTNADATNVGETMQHVWQVQQGCQAECHGVSESQTVSQHSTTEQSATASGPGEGGSLPDWLIAFAQSIGATIQTIYQYEEADCLEHCGEEALAQEASQLASTDQTAAAGDVPKPEPAPAPGPAEPPVVAAPPPTLQAPTLGGTPEVAAATVRSEQSHRRHHVGIHGHRRPPHRALAGLWGGTPRSAAGAMAPRYAATNGHSSRKHVAAASTPSGTPVSSAQASFEPASSHPGDGASFPWLPAALLLVAGVSAFLGLRERPGLGA